MKNIYLKLSSPDINGESSDSEHAKWIEVDAVHHQIRQPATLRASSPGGHSVGRSEHGDISITKEIDLASPMLSQAVSGGTTFKTAQIVLYRAAGEGRRIKYLEIQLKNVMVAHLSFGVDGGPLPTETMALRYTAIKWTYTKQNIDGSRAGATQGAWNLSTNTKGFED